jgi:hypothetical protein
MNYNYKVVMFNIKTTRPLAVSSKYFSRNRPSVGLVILLINKSSLKDTINKT